MDRRLGISWVLLATAVLAGGCAQWPRTTEVSSSGPLFISRTIETTYLASAAPLARLDLAVWRTADGSVSMDATFTNLSGGAFTSSSSQWLQAMVDSVPLSAVRREGSFGGPSLSPGASQAISQRGPAQSTGVLVMATQNWFIPRRDIGPGAMTPGSIVATVSLESLPVLP